MWLLAMALTGAQAVPPAAPAPPTTLKATIKMSVAKIDMPAVGAEVKPAPSGNCGPLLMQLLTPEGPVAIQYIIAGEQTRADVQGRLATLPRGTAVLQKRGDESIRVINPGNKTWYEIPASQNLGVLLGTPDVTIEPTGATATIAGRVG